MGVRTACEEAVFGEDCDCVDEEDGDCVGCVRTGGLRGFGVGGFGSPWKRPPKEKKSVAIVVDSRLQLECERRCLVVRMVGDFQVIERRGLSLCEA